MTQETLTRQEPETEARLVSALARGITILRAFTATRHELSIKELMLITGLPKPTLQRLLDTLCELGMLRFSERLSRYVPGLGLLHLAAPVLARMTIRQLARPLMEELANHMRGQVALIAAHRYDMTYVEIIQGVDSMLFRPELGAHISLSRTASGRAYLLQMAEDERAEYLRTHFHDADGTRTAWLRDRLEQARKDLAEYGLCRSHGDLHREIETVAVPLRTRLDGETWVVAASVARFNLQADQLLEDIGPRTVMLVRSVEAALGNAG